LTRQLQLAGFKTEVANHGVECLDILEEAVETKDKFDIILMDLEMPIMNGIVATEEIREREASGKLSGRIPIIAVTGNARAGYMDKGAGFQTIH
jgi:CheY-like chemotaxis protein